MKSLKIFLIFLIFIFVNLLTGCNKDVYIEIDKNIITYVDEEYKLSPYIVGVDKEVEFIYNSSNRDILDIDIYGNVSSKEIGKVEVSIGAIGYLNKTISTIIEVKDRNAEIYTFTELNEKEIRIESYVGKTSDSTLKIPSIINGKSVVSIGPWAFADDFNGNRSIVKVIIPETVSMIYTGAFSNNSKLEIVDFTYGSKLNTLYDTVFSNCISLKKINLNNSLFVIGDNVFENCISLEKLHITENVSYIGKNVFNGSGIIEITVDENNKEFIIENRTLMNFDKSIIYYTFA